MSIRFTCSHCGKKLKAFDDQAGKEAVCTGCGQTNKIPQAASAVPPEEEEDEKIQIPRRPQTDDELDMTPMIDMTFLLLIFFMVTASFNLQKSISIPAPDSTEGAAQTRSAEAPDEDDFVQVQIRGGGEEDVITINGETVPSRQELISRLKRIKEESGARSMIVAAAEDCHHETVVMVMDSGAAAQMEKIRLTAAEE